MEEEKNLEEERVAKLMTDDGGACHFSSSLEAPRFTGHWELQKPKGSKPSDSGLHCTLHLRCVKWGCGVRKKSSPSVPRVSSGDST